jgi:DNA-binding NtrC family response regulator
MQIGVETSRAVETKRVFVVDSDEITRAALTFMLHDENETHELSSLAQAYARGAERQPDLVLLGLPIALENGMEVLGEVSTRFPGTKILLVAGAADAPLAQAGLAAGAHGVLTGPFTVESVRRRVDRMLGRSTAPEISIVTD